MGRVLSARFDCEKFINQFEEFIAQSEDLSLISNGLSLNLEIYRSNTSHCQVNLLKQIRNLTLPHKNGHAA
jgi:hypothetical protein